jgi:acetyl esterase
MPLDPDAEILLEMVRAANRPSFETVGAAEARPLFNAGRKVLAPDPMPVAELRDLAIPGPGGPIPARLYRAAASGILPVLVFFHGGGWVVGDIETHDTVCRHLANRAECAVVSVDYRLAPEHKFPAAVEDAFAATGWVADNAARLGLDPDRLAVGGDSAGGNLAAVVSLMARDAGAPRICHQLLIYPATEAAMRHESVARFAEGYVLTRSTMRWFYEQYLRTSEDAADWRVSPLAAPDLARLPPALVLTAGYDPLCDEGDAYAERLAATGVRVQHRRFAGQIHGFATNGKIIRAAETALDEAAAALKQAWNQELLLGQRAFRA